MTNRYIHTEQVHNLASPMEIVPPLVKIFHPESVVDLGCGIGTFLHVFKQQGVSEVLGIDGQWVDRTLLAKYIHSNEFAEKDVRFPLNTGRKFDLVLSLEVAEHIEEEYAEQFIDNLISLGDTIVFSAAIPGQEGQNHVNLQWPEYWEKKFRQRGFKVYDVLRQLYWSNNKISWWYRQNMFLVAKELPRYFQEMELAPNTMLNSVHPALYESLIREKTDRETGNYSIRWYMKSLAKAIRRKMAKNAEV